MTVNFNTGIGSRHTVKFNFGPTYLDDYEISRSWDPSRNSNYAHVTLYHHVPGGGSFETVITYEVTDEMGAYEILARALRISTKKWEVRKRKFIFRYRLGKATAALGIAELEESQT